MNGIFLQGNSYDSVFRYERHLVFPKMMKNNCPDFSVDQSFYNADLEKEGTCRRYDSDVFGALKPEGDVPESLIPKPDPTRKSRT